MVEINVLNPDGSVKNDIAAGKYDIEMVSGPSFSTKRQEAAEGMMQFMQSAPEEAALVMDLMVKNLDWPGADEIYERMRKRAIARGLVEPDPEKGEQPPAPEPPSAEMVLAEAEQMKAQADLLNAQTRQMEARTSLGKGIASSRKDQAATQKLEAEAEGQEITNATDIANLIMQSGQFQQAIEAVVETALRGVVEPQDYGVNTSIGPNGGVT
jgi:hypothetical protein